MVGDGLTDEERRREAVPEANGVEQHAAVGGKVQAILVRRLDRLLHDRRPFSRRAQGLLAREAQRHLELLSTAHDGDAMPGRAHRRLDHEGQGDRRRVVATGESRVGVRDRIRVRVGVGTYRVTDRVRVRVRVRVTKRVSVRRQAQNEES